MQVLLQGRIQDLNTTCFFAYAQFWASGDNLCLKRPANSYKRVAAGVQKKPKHCRALKVTNLSYQKSLNLRCFSSGISCQIYASFRHQSLKYCNGNMHFLQWKVIRVQSLTFFSKCTSLTRFFSCSQF